MANKRNYEWPQASAWDGYFTQDKVGGTTQRVDPSLVFDRLRAEGFLVKAIKDNAYDSGDDITEVQELTFFRNQGTGANYPILSSEERTYGVLLPAPALQADQGKVPMYKGGDQIAWETVPTEESLSETIEHILDLSTLGEENTTFDVVLTANHNNAISFVGTSEETATVAIEIENDKPCHIQIVGACTLAITGVSWIGVEITAITTNAEISILNNVAVGVLYE